MENEIPAIPKDRAEYFKHRLANARDLSRQVEFRLVVPIDVDAILTADREELEKRGSLD